MFFLHIYIYIYITSVFSSFFNVISMCDADIGWLSSVENSEAVCWISQYKTVYVVSNDVCNVTLQGNTKAHQRVAVAFGNKVCWFESQYRHTSLCSPGSWRVLACWFESHYRHISLCSPRSWTRASSNLRKQTMLVRFRISAYFFM
jgi:hypothetical protein